MHRKWQSKLIRVYSFWYNSVFLLGDHILYNFAFNWFRLWLCQCFSFKLMPKYVVSLMGFVFCLLSLKFKFLVKIFPFGRKIISVLVWFGDIHWLGFFGQLKKGLDGFCTDWFFKWLVTVTNICVVFNLILIECFTASLRSLIYIRMRKDPRPYPCCTPYAIYSWLADTSLIGVFCHLLSRYHLQQSNIIPLILRDIPF